MNRLLWIATHLLMSISAQAQNWKACGFGTIGPTAVQTLYGDSISDRLLAGGTFAWIKNEDDTVFGIGQAAWNGSRWDTIAHRISEWGGGNSAQQTFWFLRFGGDLYACGGFHTNTQEVNQSLARLNETEQRWEALECPNPDGGIVTLVPKQPQSTLYATGHTGSLCGYPESCVFRYDGSAFHIWEPFQQIPDDENGNYVGFIFDFQGMTYMTGLFRDPLSSGSLSMARYNGSSWEYVPGWTTLAGIKEISIHNDTLYVVGAFRESQGGPGNLVAGFDGENWFNLGTGLMYPAVPNSGVAHDIEWFHNELYVSGFFREAGGVHVESIAKWNGHQWCGLMETVQGPVAPYTTITDMTVWRDSLYICGGFRLIDGDTIRQVAQWIGGDATTNCSTPVSIGQHEQLPMFSVTPNPATTSITLQGLPPTAATVLVFDAFGRQVLRTNVMSQVLSVDLLPIGTYMVRVLDARGRALGDARFVRY